MTCGPEKKSPKPKDTAELLLRRNILLCTNSRFDKQSH